MEKISIIVPIYNVEKYLEQCINSIIEQTYQNLEIILVDDGATDNSGKICDEYLKKDNRIKVIHKQNGGLSDARNAGVEIATGDFIGFVDSDDYIEKDMYELLHRNMLKEGADISCCNRFLVYENKIEVYGTDEYYEVMNSSRAIEFSCMIGYIGISAYTKLYQKELFDEIRYPKGKINEDMYTTYKLFDKANKVIYDATPKYYYRQRKGSITNSKKINVNAIEASRELMVFVKEKYPEIMNAAIKNYIYSSIGVYDNIVKNKSKTVETQRLKNQIIEEVRKYYGILKKDKTITKQRKMQLILIRYFEKIYVLLFNLYDTIKAMIKKKQ